MENVYLKVGKSPKKSAPRLCKMLNRAVKLIVCLVLCCALVWGYSYKEPVEVDATAVVGVGIEVAIAVGLSVLGIGVAGTVSGQSYQQMIDKIKDTQLEQAAAGCTAVMTGGKLIYNLTQPFLHQLATSFMNVYNKALSNQALKDFGYPLSGPIANKRISELLPSIGFPNPPISDGRNLNNIENVVSYSIMAAFPITLEGVSEFSYAGNYIAIKHSYQGLLHSSHYQIKYDNSSFEDVNWKIDTTSNYGYFIAFTYAVGYSSMYLVSHGLASTQGASSDTNIVGLGRIDAIPEAPGMDVYGLGIEKYFADGVSALNNSIDDVISKVRERLGIGNDVDIPVSVPSDKVDDKLRDISQEKVLDKDIATEDDKAKDEDTNKDKDTTPPKPPTLPDLSLPEIIFKEKFPFCLPWDLYLAFSNLVAPPKPPVFEINFLHVPALHWDYSVTLDLTPYEKLATLSRWGFSLLFTIGLILITKKIIS